MCSSTLFSVSGGGGWTLVAWINGGQQTHANSVNAIGDPALRTNGAKYSDALINSINFGGKYWYTCGTKNVWVRTDSGNKPKLRTNILSKYPDTLVGLFNGLYTNSENWSLDNQKDGTFECVANRAGYVFADYPSCAAGHSNFGSSYATGCYNDGQGWGMSGALWVR
jgi:hypothetical protein